MFGRKGKDFLAVDQLSVVNNCEKVREDVFQSPKQALFIPYPERAI